jgi:hypothetical protein
MTTSFTHSKECADWKAAALDRKQREAKLLVRQERQQLLARAAWLDWYRKSRQT